MDSTLSFANLYNQLKQFVILFLKSSYFELLLVTMNKPKVKTTATADKKFGDRCFVVLKNS